MEPFNIGKSLSSVFIVVSILMLGAFLLISRIRGSHSNTVLTLSLALLCLLSLQWVLYDVALAVELGVASAESEMGMSVKAGVGVLDAALAPVPENIGAFHSLILTAFQMLFVIAIPVVLTGVLLKRARLRECLVSCASGILCTLQMYLIVASLRQLCALPDAHGP